MKKIIGAALILSMLGGSAAFAAPAYSNNRGYSDHHDNSGAVIAGVGLLALAAIFASQNNHDDYGYRSDYRHDDRGWGDHRDYRDYRGGYDNHGWNGRR